jgi:hypothetical protein
VGDEVVERHAQELPDGVAEQLPERGVGLQDVARGCVEQEDAFGGLLDHRPVAFFALGQRVFGLLALADVPCDGQHRRFAPVGDGDRHPLDVHRPSVEP